MIVIIFHKVIIFQGSILKKIAYLTESINRLKICSLPPRGKCLVWASFRRRWFSKVFKFIKIYYNSGFRNRMILKLCTIIDIDNSSCFIKKKFTHLVFYRRDLTKCVFYRRVCNSVSRNGMMLKLCTMIGHHTYID